MDIKKSSKKILTIGAGICSIGVNLSMRIRSKYHMVKSILSEIDVRVVPSAWNIAREMYLNYLRNLTSKVTTHQKQFNLMLVFTVNCVKCYALSLRYL
jgi:hypothetical protein